MYSYERAPECKPVLGMVLEIQMAHGWTEKRGRGEGSARLLLDLGRLKSDDGLGKLSIIVQENEDGALG